MRRRCFSLGERTLRPDDLIGETGLPTQRVLTVLTILTMRGFLTERPGNGFEAVTVFRAPDDAT